MDIPVSPQTSSTLGIISLKNCNSIDAKWSLVKFIFFLILNEAPPPFFFHLLVYQLSLGMLILAAPPAKSLLSMWRPSSGASYSTAFTSNE